MKEQVGCVCVCVEERRCWKVTAINGKVKEREGTLGEDRGEKRGEPSEGGGERKDPPYIL